MPANLTPQYLAAEERFKQAASVQEKIEALEEMMALIPKHKGTEKLQADLKRKKARLQAEGEKKHGASKVSSLHTVPREGAGQVVLVGAPNVGKSSLLARMTKATPEIADYPFTTRLPQPGMMPYENIQIQIVDLPAIAPESYEPWLGSLVRQADLVLLMVDLSSDELLEEVDSVLKLLDDSRLELRAAPAVRPGDPAAAKTQKQTLLLANKRDAANATDNLQILEEFFGEQFPIFPISTRSGDGLETLRETIFHRLGVIRIYTKPPGKKPDFAAPTVLSNGSTVLDAAVAVHRDFEHTLKYAKLWSSEKSAPAVKHDGQMVERTHRLEDGDILELHG